MLGKAENAFVNPLAEPDRRQPDFFRMPQQVLLFLGQESGASFVELSSQPIWDSVLDIDDRPRPMVKLLPVEILVAGFEEFVARERAVEAYRQVWRAAFPEAEIDRALELAPSVDLMFQAVSYEGLIRAVEPMSRWEIGGMVARNLRRLGTSS